MKITDALLGEHAVFVAQFDRLDQDVPAVADAAIVREEAALMASALVTHARLEDELLFDRLEGAGADPGLLATMKAEHQTIEAALRDAQGTADVARARERLLEAVAVAREHFAREERFAFPMAEALLSAHVLRALGAAWARRRDVHLPEPDAG